MDPNKLKALKVAELKDILSTASVPFPAKSNKQDLVQRILASPAAIDVYNKKQQPSSHDDLFAPPEDVDWTADDPSALEPPQSAPAAQPVVAPEPVKKPASKVKHTKSTAPAPPLTQPVATATAPSTELDELEKRKLRAARFGIPLVETPNVTSTRGKKDSPDRRSTRAPGTSSPANVDDSEKLKSRAARFNFTKQTTAITTPSKRLADEDVDEEEREKRQKRQERFGGGVVKI